MGRALEVAVPAAGVTLLGELSIPDAPRGVVVFAHGSGSSRHSPRNRWVAHHLQSGGLATLLMDLLSAEEEQEDTRTRRLRFDVDLLAGRVTAAVDWLGRLPDTRTLAVGCFGASTGAAAALIAAARCPARIRAVVSRGGRPDLAGGSLARVRCPTLLIVGGDDVEVIDLNRRAQARLTCPTHLEIVGGATHLFEEAGALERVAACAASWFLRYLGTIEQKVPPA